MYYCGRLFIFLYYSLMSFKLGLFSEVSFWTVFMILVYLHTSLRRKPKNVEHITAMVTQWNWGGRSDCSESSFVIVCEADAQYL